MFLGTTVRMLWDELERIQKKAKRVLWGTWYTEVWMILRVCSRGEWGETWILKYLKSVVKGVICFLLMRWGELGGWVGREICNKDNTDWMLAEVLGKDYLERLWSLDQWRSWKAGWENLSQKPPWLLVQLWSRRVGKKTLWGALPILLFVDEVRMNTGPPPMLWGAIQVIGFIDFFVVVLLLQHSK